MRKLKGCFLFPFFCKKFTLIEYLGTYVKTLLNEFFQILLQLIPPFITMTIFLNCFIFRDSKIFEIIPKLNFGPFFDQELKSVSILKFSNFFTTLEPPSLVKRIIEHIFSNIENVLLR